MFCCAYSIFSDVYYKIFIKRLSYEFIGLFLESILEIEMLYFVCKKSDTILLASIIIFMKNYFFY